MLRAFLSSRHSSLRSGGVLHDGDKLALRLSTTHQNPILLNQAVQYLRIQALKGDLNAKVKLGTVLDGQLLAEVTAASHNDIDTTSWQYVLDKREADLWGQCIFDHWLSPAMTPCFGLIESDISLKQNTSNDDTDSIKTLFRLVDSIISLANDESVTNNKTKRDMCYLVGLMQLKGVGLEKNLDRSVTYFKRASELNHDGASYQLAMMMEDRHRYPDLYNMEESVELYEKMVSNKQDSGATNAALSGPDAWALTKLARVYYEGDHQGQSQNLNKAYTYARKVAENNGEKYCQFMVGDILLKQKGDIHQSLFWLTQSGQQGFPLAIEVLARIYFEGYPALVKPDYSLAYEWCVKGDDIWPSGLGYCQSCLGDMYRQGLGVPKDQMKSFEYYQKAASQQEDPQNYARYMLGEMFYHGDGWVQNLPVAKDYYQIAAQEQYQPARQRLLEIEANERQQLEQQELSQRTGKPWRLMSLFSNRRKVAA